MVANRQFYWRIITWTIFATSTIVAIQAQETSQYGGCKSVINSQCKEAKIMSRGTKTLTGRIRSHGTDRF